MTKRNIYNSTFTGLIISLIALISGTRTANSQNTFLKTFGGVRYDEMHTMIRSHDGGFIMAGSTESFGQGNLGVTDAYVVKTDSAGNIKWSRTLGLQVYDDIFWVEPTNDSAYMICGVASDNDTSIGILLVKISETGNILWQKVMEQDHAGIGYCVRQTTDGGFIVAAEILQLDNLDFLLIKTDANGNVQWSKQIGSLQSEVPGYIMQTSDGGYLVCGTSRENSATIPMYLVKTDNAGNVEWQKTYNTSPPFSKSTISNAIETADGGYVIAGTNTNNQLFSDIIVMKIDNAGDQQWIRSFGGIGDDYCGSMIENSDGNIVVCGSSAFSYNGNLDALIILMDPDGYFIKASLFGSTAADDAFASVVPMADGGYMLGGNTSSYNQLLDGDFMMMKINKDLHGPECDTLVPSLISTLVFFTDTTDFSEAAVTVTEHDVFASIDSGANDSMLCDVATGELPPPITEAISMYPNPATHWVSFSGDHNGINTVEIYSLPGIKISSLPFSSNMDVSGLADGCYLICFKNKAGIIVQRLELVKQ